MTTREDPVPLVKKIRLLKFTTNFLSGGTEGQIYNLVKQLDNTKFDLELACMGEFGHYLEFYQQSNIPISHFPMHRLYSPSTLYQMLRFGSYLRSRKIDIMHSYNHYANVFALPAAKLAGTPLVIGSIRDRGDYLSPSRKKIQKWAFKFADKILVNAESIREWLLEEGYDGDKIVVIKNGIDLAKCEQAEKTNSVRAEFRIPENAPIVIMLCRLNIQKGVGDFIQAAAILKQEFPEVYYLLVGSTSDLDVDLFDQWKQQATNAGLAKRLIFTGYRTDAQSLFAQSTISVLPSHSEGLSNTLIESMAMGVPVVTTNVGGSPELVDHKVSGLLVPPKQPVALAEAMAELLRNPGSAKKMGLAAREKIFAEFSIEHMAQETQKFYQEQLNNC